MKYEKKKGAVSITKAIIGIVLAVILVLAVAIPVTQQMITSANLTGVAAVLAGILPTGLVLFVLVLIFTLMG
ncbi:MAG: hypothetical protein QXD48_03860 [Candidatus Aenigmatarchaeota archaeon]